jgi:two-component system, NarL family, nitrate/nitrite response regulator NarL
VDAQWTRLEGKAMIRRATVYLADDHPLFREGLTRAVAHRADLELVGQAGDGRHALTEIRVLHPDVALVGMRTPGLDGLGLLQAIVRDKLSTSVVLLAGEPSSELLYRAIAGGAVGFVSKNLERDEICDAVAAAARGETRLSFEIQRQLVHEVGLHGGSVRPTLTTREREVLELIADGLSAPAIASRLTLSVATIKSHQGTLYDKLDVSDRAAAAAKAIRIGLLD